MAPKILRKTTTSFKEEVLSGFPRMLVGGADEVGRGCLAGPVVCAAFVFPPSFHRSRPKWLKHVTDSKLIPPPKRSELASQLKEVAAAYEVVFVGVDIIDEINIFHASMLGMKQAVDRLKSDLHHVLIDGNSLPKELRCAARPVVKGDLKSYSIAAASILAKVARDEWMSQQDHVYPGYNFTQHKGYPTSMHWDRLEALGVTPLHRRSFNGIREIESGGPGTRFRAMAQRKLDPLSPSQLDLDGTEYSDQTF